MSDITERIALLIDNQGITKQEFEKKLGLSNGAIGKIITEGRSFRIDLLDKILKVYPKTNIKWLVTGEGNMFLSNELPVSLQGIPIYRDLAFAGIMEHGDSSYMPDGYLHIPGFENATMALIVYGNSMVPHYQSGEIILVKEVRGDASEWPWNKPALVITKNGGRYLKFLQRSGKGQMLALLSSNPETPLIEVPVQDVIRIYMVMGKVVKHDF